MYLLTCYPYKYTHADFFCDMDYLVLDILKSHYDYDVVSCLIDTWCARTKDARTAATNGGSERAQRPVGLATRWPASRCQRLTTWFFI